MTDKEIETLVDTRLEKVLEKVNQGITDNMAKLYKEIYRLQDVLKQQGAAQIPLFNGNGVHNGNGKT